MVFFLFSFSLDIPKPISSWIQEILPLTTSEIQNLTRSSARSPHQPHQDTLLEIVPVVLLLKNQEYLKG